MAPPTGGIQKKVLFGHFFRLLFDNMVQYAYVGQQANINRQQAPVIAENRTFSYQQIHTKKHYLSSQTRF